MTNSETKVEIPPPAAKTVSHTFTHLGSTYEDPYAWLQDPTDPEVLAYLEAENDYAKALLAHTEPLQERLFQEMRNRIPEDDASAPERRGEYFYYSRLQPVEQYRRFCRKRGSHDAGEELLLDENRLADQHSYCRVFVYEPSPDGRFLAYSVDTTGALVFDLYVKDLQTGELAAGPVPNTAYTAAWASDSRTLFYTTFDAAHRSDSLCRLEVGEPAAQALVYREPDEAFILRVRRSRSGAYLFLDLKSASTSEVHYLPAGEPEGEFRVIQPRIHWLEYWVEHHGDRFFILTNDEAENFKLVEAPIASPGRDHWQTLIPAKEDTFLEDVLAFRDHLVLVERRGGLPRLRVSAPDAVARVSYPHFPDPVYTLRVGANPEFDTNRLRFAYSSLVTPEMDVDLDLDTGEWEVVKRREVPGGYDPSRLETERIEAIAPDGARVPVSLVYRKDLPHDGSPPLLLEGYGAYGFSYEPSFDSRRLSLLERGFVFAIAHVRGGSELGRAWYEAGRLMHKMNSFTDLIACAETLIARGYTSPRRLAIEGRSAGGLLVSAAMTLRPDLFQAVAAVVPFTNVITAMLDPNLPLTVIEYEQWGHPGDLQAFETMRSYSPYENVAERDYPHLLVTAGLYDLQVPYWDPAKWVAKLRAHKTGSNRLALVTNLEAGHGGASGRYNALHETARIYAFLIDNLGAPWEPVTSIR